MGGLWGVVAVGLFSRGPEFAGGLGSLKGLFHGGGGELLGVQLIGAMSIMAWTAIGTLLSMLLIGMTLGLRVSPEDEDWARPAQNRALVLAARTLNAKRKSRVTLSLR